MRGILLALLFLGGCPKGPLGAGSETERRDVVLRPDPFAPGLCLPALPGAEPLKGEAAEAYRQGLEDLQAFELGSAAVALGRADAHPAARAALGVAALLEDQEAISAAFFDPLVLEFPDDPCLLQSAALSAWVAGEAETARDRAERAWEAAPDDPDTGYLLALILGDQEPEAAQAHLEEVLERHPGHGLSRFAQAMVLMEADQVDEGIAALEAAKAAGLPVEPLLVDAYRYTDRTEDALRLHSELGAPLGDDGRIATAEDPWATYYGILGADPDLPFFAVIATSLGLLRCELALESAPVAVASFVGLSRGTIPWVHPDTGEERTDALYPHTGFHRVIPGFMVQAGDPAGDGTGGPGYRFLDEVDRDLGFDRPGVLAMANAGPGTNGSQFFVTEAPTPHLHGRHTVLGYCDEASVAVVEEIARVATDEQDRPLEPVRIESIRFESGARRE